MAKLFISETERSTAADKMSICSAFQRHLQRIIFIRMPLMQRSCLTIYAESHYSNICCLYGGQFLSFIFVVLLLKYNFKRTLSVVEMFQTWKKPLLSGSTWASSCQVSVRPQEALCRKKTIFVYKNDDRSPSGVQNFEILTADDVERITVFHVIC